MKSLLKKIRIGIICGPYLLYCYFAWIRPYSSHPDKYPLELRYKRARKLILVILSHLCGDFKVENKPILDTEESKFFVANHVNMLDPLMLVAFSPKPVCFIAKKETEKLPFVGRIIKALGGIFLDRDDPRQAIRVFQIAMKNIQEKTAHVAIFPEGTRNHHPYEHDLKEFHPGSFKIAQRTNTPITPVAIFGTFSLMKSNTLYHRYLVQVSFLDEIPASIFNEKKNPEIAVEVRDLVQQKFVELRDNDVAYYKEKKYKGKTAKWWKDENIVEKYEK